MAETILEKGDLAVTRHAGTCGGCGSKSIDTRTPRYQLSTLARMEGQPSQYGYAYICLCWPCLAEAYSIVKKDQDK